MWCYRRLLRIPWTNEWIHASYKLTENFWIVWNHWNLDFMVTRHRNTKVWRRKSFKDECQVTKIVVDKCRRWTVDYASPTLLMEEGTERRRRLSFSLPCPSGPAMRPDSLLRLWRYIILLLTYKLTDKFIPHRLCGSIDIRHSSAAQKAKTCYHAICIKQYRSIQFLARDSIICLACYMLSPVRLSVCHTGGSFKNGWSLDDVIFTIR